MSDLAHFYAHINIRRDDTGGLLTLGTIKRHSADRATKVTNNFLGLASATDPQLLTKLCAMLAAKLPAKHPDEIVVGLEKSGIVMCAYLAGARQSKFNWSTTDKLGETDTVFHYAENERGKAHYLHGLQPGDHVILVEDEVTTGRGIAGLTLALRDYGVEVDAICSILETINFDGKAHIRNRTGLELISLAEIELRD